MKQNIGKFVTLLEFISTRVHLCPFSCLENQVAKKERVLHEGLQMRHNWKSSSSKLSNSHIKCRQKELWKRQYRIGKADRDNSWQEKLFVMDDLEMGESQDLPQPARSPQNGRSAADLQSQKRQQSQSVEFEALQTHANDWNPINCKVTLNCVMEGRAVPSISSSSGYRVVTFLSFSSLSCSIWIRIKLSLAIDSPVLHTISSHWAKP